MIAVKRCYVSKKPPGKRHSKHSLPARKLAVDGRLLLRLHAAGFVGHEQHTLQPFVLAVVSEVLSVPLPM